MLSAGKHPVTPHGFKNATVTELGIRPYWTTKPHNIGVDLGAGNLLVVDLDSRRAVESWNAGPFGELRTARVSTGKGAHVYFRQDPGDWAIGSVPQSKISQAHGVPKTEIRGNEAYTVLPPSRHASGRVYTWADPTVPIALLPDELRDWVLAAGASVGRTAPTRRAAARPGTGQPIRSPQGYTVAALKRLAHSTIGSRNNDACAVALALADVAEAGGYKLEQLRVWFFSAAADCGLLADEPDKTHELWCRMTGDDFPVSEMAA